MMKERPDKAVERARLLAAIQKGDDELNRGEGIAYSPRVLNDITDTALKGGSDGEPMDPDVLPQAAPSRPACR